MNTPEQAATLLCPFARSFAVQPVASCRGPACACWRWEQITTAHPLWKDAVRAKAEELGEKAPFPKAAAWVAENKTALGMVPTRGQCGIGGL